MYCWHISPWAGFKTLLLELSLNEVLLLVLLVIAIKIVFIVVLSQNFTARPCCYFEVSPQMRQLQHWHQPRHVLHSVRGSCSRLQQTQLEQGRMLTFPACGNLGSA